MALRPSAAPPTPSSLPLTARQAEILAFLIAFTEREGFVAGLRDICARFGFASTQAAAQHVVALARKGYVARGARRRQRTLRVLRTPAGVPVVLRFVPAAASSASVAA